VLELRTPRTRGKRTLLTAALLLLAVFLGRHSIMALHPLSNAGGIAAVSRELFLNQVVVGGCGLVILSSLAFFRLAGPGRRL
jgi:hypothetical protein